MAKTNLLFQKESLKTNYLVLKLFSSQRFGNKLILLPNHSLLTPFSTHFTNLNNLNPIFAP